MKRLAFLASLGLVVALGILVAAPGQAFQYPESRHGKGELKYIEGVPVMFVQGTPAEIGEQTAVLAGNQAARVHAYPRDLIAKLTPLFRNRAWQYVVRSGEELLPQFPPAYRQEFDAMVKAGLNRDLILAVNTMFDLKNDDRPDTKKLFPKLHQLLFGCSSMIVRAEESATNGAIFGRNLDYPSLGYLHEYSLVVVCRPEGKRAFASVTFPGVIGCLSGINDAGLALAVHEVHETNERTAHFSKDGVPYALCHRRILEECATIAEAKKLLEGMKRTTTTNLALCDRAGGVILEVSPDAVEERPAAKGVNCCTNHYLLENMRPAEQPDRGKTLSRFKALEAAGETRARRATLADVQKALNDAHMGPNTLQTMIFEPAAMKLHVAFGPCPTTKLPMRTLDLAPLLKPIPGPNDR